MKRVRHLFVPSLTGCLLVASLLSSCTGIHGPMSVPAAGGPQPDTSGTEPSPIPPQVGIASWYGKEFHGRPTASGEKYDMYQPTAAHRTAPLGTFALVTNLDNGQSVRVRINDRGPHKRQRLLDLSYEAARQITMLQTGSARVKVEFLADPVPLPQPQPAVLLVARSPEQRPTMQVLRATGTPPFVVQAGAYQDQGNAVRVQKTLTSLYPNVWITIAPENTQPLHRVRLGPFQNRDEAERVISQVKARGYAAALVAMTQ